MILALDANVVIDLVRGRESVRRAYIHAEQEHASFAISVLAVQELRFGAGLGDRPDAEHRLLDGWLKDMSVIPYEIEDASIAARTQAEMQRKGRRAPYDDFLIGAHALARGHTLVTANTRHFAHIPGLQLVDWTRPLAPEQDLPHV